MSLILSQLLVLTHPPSQLLLRTQPSLSQPTGPELARICGASTGTRPTNDGCLALPPSRLVNNTHTPTPPPAPQPLRSPPPSILLSPLASLISSLSPPRLSSRLLITKPVAVPPQTAKFDSKHLQSIYPFQDTLNTSREPSQLCFKWEVVLFKPALNQEHRVPPTLTFATGFHPAHPEANPFWFLGAVECLSQTQSVRGTSYQSGKIRIPSVFTSTTFPALPSKTTGQTVDICLFRKHPPTELFSPVFEFTRQTSIYYTEGKQKLTGEIGNFPGENYWFITRFGRSESTSQTDCGFPDGWSPKYSCVLQNGVRKECASHRIPKKMVEYCENSDKEDDVPLDELEAELHPEVRQCEAVVERQCSVSERQSRVAERYSWGVER
ncbi:hypothetical protein C8F01DRAFT_1088493 [Mycena amicta]|nr:hypothetical protein C8F01DRAFT_1088493 [Mycena amicta]